MIVLSRKRNEVIRISDDVSIVVVDIRGDRVRLGIDAPRNIEIHREEIYQAIHGALAEDATPSDEPEEPAA